MIEGVVFIAKTDLNTDGRILNQLEILKRRIPNFRADLVLLPDEKTSLDFKDDVTLHELSLFSRHISYLRLFTVLEFTIKSLLKLLALKPKILHVQDSAVVLPCLIYSFLRSDTRLVYDDHEIPNENPGFLKRFLNYLELALMKRSDFILHANEEREDYLVKKYNLKVPSSHFLNLPFFNDEGGECIPEEFQILDTLDDLKAAGYKLIMHQGVINTQRGAEHLARIANNLPRRYKILLLGGSPRMYEKFIADMNVDKSHFIYIGKVDYEYLPFFWAQVMASIVMYLPTYINNRLCAPNRFFLSIFMSIPVIVNRSNPVLQNFVEKYKCGLFVEDLERDDFWDNLDLITDKKFINELDLLREEQVKNLLMAYDLI